MSKYGISHNMDPYYIIDCLSDSEEVDFVFDCYDYLDGLHQKAFVKMLGAKEVVDLLGEEKVVRQLKDDLIIEELKMRGYIITKKCKMTEERLKLINW